MNYVCELRLVRITLLYWTSQRRGTSDSIVHQFKLYTEQNSRKVPGSDID